jgi:Lrp/AsnC family transcriptional regulator, leucine-responsive regulatory protein
MLVASHNTRRSTASSTPSDGLGGGSERAAPCSGITPGHSKPASVPLGALGRERCPARKLQTPMRAFGYASCVPTPSPERELDATDHEIIALLCADARRPLSDIAKRVHLSSPAVKRRLDRLERLQVIIGYTARVDHAKLGRPLEAFTELRFVGSTPVDQIARIAEDIPEVQAVFTTAGDPDALAWIRVRDVADLKRVVDDLRRSGRVTGTKTLMVLGTSARTAPAL